ncbi:MAG: TolC family protein [Bacteroidota bacterium]|nr:TolC family protein [Bacteroidota bacterium]
MKTNFIILNHYINSFFIIGVIIFNTLFANAQSDTNNVFTLNDLYQSMMANHPVVKQALTLPIQARQEIRMARGTGFDPKFTSGYDEKRYNGTDYFTIWQNQLKIPTWFGAEFKAGYDEAYGKYLNPERTVPNNGLSYLGISVAVGQGLFIDQRRATLRQSQLSQKINEAEKVKLINKILYQAAKDYWNWYFHYNKFKSLEIGYNFALERYEFVKKRVNIGEEAAIDSTEALILLQNRYVTYSQSQMELQNASLELSNHIWGPSDTPLELTINAKPETFNPKTNSEDTNTVQILIQYAKKNHPELLKFDFKIGQLNIEKKLAIENIKPIINLNYNLLGAGINASNNISSGIYKDYYKTGFDVVVPLFLRKERAKLQVTKLKIKQTEFERSFTSRQISNEIMQFFNELKNSERLLSTQTKLIENYYILKEAEFNKFNNGESSLFLVNTRETNLIDARIKRAELEAKYEKSKAGLYWSAGKNNIEQ